MQMIQPPEAPSPQRGLNLVLFWRRLPLSAKLLLPLGIAFVIVLLAFTLFITPALSGFVRDSVTLGFITEYDRIYERLNRTIADCLAPLKMIEGSNELNQLGSALLENDTNALPSLRAVLASRMANVLLNSPIPMANIRLSRVDGTQLVAAHIVTLNERFAASTTLTDVETPDAQMPYFNAATRLPVSHYVMSDAVVVEAQMLPNTPESASRLSFQIAAPVYVRGELVGILAADVRPATAFAQVLQPVEGSTFEFTHVLYDTANNPIAVVNPRSETPVVFSGEPIFEAPTIEPALANRLAAEANNIFSFSDRSYRNVSFAVDPALNIENVGWRLLTSKSVEDAALNNALALARQIVVRTAVLFLVVLAVFGFIAQSVVNPLRRLSQLAGRIAEGDFDTRIPVRSSDEVGQLANVLNGLSSRLKSVVGTLEGRVLERTRNLEIAAQIGREATQLRDIPTLLQTTVEAIRDRFNFYHAQVFLVDDVQEYAVLITSTGEAGRQLLSRKHKLAIGSNSIVGQTTAKRRPFITLDTQQSEVPHRFNPLLPLTRSEMALPLQVGDKLIGCLDVQSVEPNAFDQEDVQIFQLLADQMAIAIDNANLIEESQRRVSQVDDLNRQLTRSSWQDYFAREARGGLEYQYDLLRIAPVEPMADSAQTIISAPIQVRGERVGELTVRESPELPLSTEERSIVQAVADRVAMVIENTRLVEQTQNALNRVEQLYQATRTLSSAIDAEKIYQIAAERFATYEMVDRVVFLVARPSPEPNASHLEIGYFWERKPHPDHLEAPNLLMPRTVLPEAWLPKERVPFLAQTADMAAQKEQLAASWAAMGVHATLITPLITAGRWFGVFVCQSMRPNAFGESFIQFNNALADQISIALENQYLFDAAQVEARNSRALAEAAQFASQIGVDFETGVGELIERVAPAAEFSQWWFGQLRLTIRGVVAERVAASFPNESPLHELEQVSLEGVHTTLTEAIRTGQVVVVNAPRQHSMLSHLDPRHAEAYGKHIVIPMRVGNRAEGILMLGRDSNQRDVAERDRQLALSLSSQIAVALENRRLFNVAQEERDNLIQILNSLPTGVVVVDALTERPVLTNQQARTLLGLDALEPYQMYRTTTGSPYNNETMPAMRTLHEGVTITAEDMTVVDRDGNRTDLLVSAVPIMREGRIVSAVAVYQDVTDLRDLESVLQESLRETTTLYETSRAIAAENDVYGILNVVGRQVFMQIQPEHFYIIFNNNGTYAPIYSAWETPDGLTVDEMDLERPLPVGLLTSDTFVDTNIGENPDWADDPHLKALGAASLSVFPMRARQHVVAWLVIGFNEQRAFSSDERRTLGNLADQTAVALDSTQLAQETAQALQTTRLLYDASLSIRRADTAEGVLEAIRDQLSTLQPDRIDVFLVITQDNTQHIDWVMAWQEDDPETHTIHTTGAPSVDHWEMINQESYYIADLAQAPEALRQAMISTPIPVGYAAQAAVPLQVKDRITGRIVLSYHRPRAFALSDQQLLLTLADQMAITLDNFLLVRQTLESLEETAILYQTSSAIASSRGPQDELQALIDYASPPFVKMAMIGQLSAEDLSAPDAGVEILTNWLRDLEEGESLDLSGIYFTPDQFPFWQLVAELRPIWIEDLSDANTYADIQDFDPSLIFEAFQVQSVVIYPLLGANQTPLGTLILGAEQPWVRSEREVRVFNSLADLMAISMERRRLLAQTERRARQLELSAEIAQTAASTLRIDELFDKSVELIRESFGYDHAQIFRITEDGQFAKVVSSTGEAGKQLLAIGHGLPVGSRSVIGQVTATGLPQIVSDTAARGAVHRPNPYLPQTRAEMALPLIARDQIVGALDLQSNRPGAFTTEDVAILSTLAGQIAVAIDNAELFQNSMRRAEEMRFLFDATRAATDAFVDIELDADKLRELAELVRDKLAATAASLLLPNSANTVLIPYSSILSSSNMSLPPTMELTTVAVRDFSSTRDPLIFNDLSMMITMMQNAPRTPQTRLIQQLRTYLPEADSLILLPLTSGDNLVGIIGAVKAQGGTFDTESARLIQTLGTSLAAIIQNARLVRELQDANTRLLELDRVKSQFLANMSHELRTPLNSIIGFSRVMLKGIDGPLTEMQQQDLSTIFESGKHLLGLVNDILDQAKIEADKMDFAIAPFAISEVVRGVASTAIGLLKDKPVKLHQEIEDGLPPVVGDEFRTRQALLNLVSNAAKFTMEGSITISAFVIEDDDRRFVQVSVADTGIGIPHEKMEAIFEPFQQVENSAARQFEGTGLGLPIAKKLIEKQGGRMWATSELGVGSTFNITLPVMVEEPQRGAVDTESVPTGD